MSEPWKTLRERIDFSKYIALKQAYVYIKDGETVGFIIFTPEPVFARGGYIRAVAVDPVMRRRGVGEKLLAFAETVIARRSPHVYLCVSSFNRRGQMFYRSLGYKRVGTLPDLLVRGASEYIYWKRLRPLPQKNRR
ncbi:MAG TPA: GNAT family N-acetyltransferase [Nitrospirota bacterium]|nr:GNAT family N-acetyltransferase [Nitrospirota bacterium]